MSTENYAELNEYRVRGDVSHALSASHAFNWKLDRDGSFLRVLATSGGPWTLTLTITASVPFSGRRVWVEFYNTNGASTLVWPANFKFQTVGDAIPAAGFGKTTIWTGIFGLASTDCFMTKLGEW
jgi:hypothetical protein